MGDNTHRLTVSGTGYTTAQVFVPASVQRDQGICIDDEVQVTIEELDGVFDSITFTGPQTGGDRVTVPADVVHGAGIVAGEEYPISFEKVEASDEDDDTDSETIEDAVESDPEEVDEGVLDDLFADDEEEEEEAEEEGLGRLFG